MSNWIDQCLERAEKASEGPWNFRDTKQSEDVDEKYFNCRRLSGKSGNRILMADAGLISDLEFIAHARTDVPELARRLKIACEALRQFRVATDELEALPEEK